MALPPPNVTGSLHIGHALDHTYQDYLARLHRMRGDEVLWLPGMDHAGIATQNVVERELAKEGKTRFDLGREAFVERVWAWKAESGGRILGQMQRLGDSVDWSRERFTMDEGLSRAVREVFVSLYEQGLLYRGRRIINWCPRCLTALSDIEVEHEEVPGELAHLRYPLADGSGWIGVATSRAETMLGDTAVAVHPDDPRYRDLVGKTVRLPLVDRLIPVVADAAVDREFGTGAVKVTPAHDPNDHEIAERHGLPAVDIFTEEAIVNAEGGRFEGLDRYAARREVKAALAELGLLERVEEAPHSVGHCYRCRTEVEPRLSLQWFVATGPLAEEAMEAVRSGQDPVRAGPLREDLLRLDGADPRLVRVPPALVGPPHPRLVLPGRARHRGPPGPGRLRHLRRGRAGPGRGRARHLVLERAVAVLDPGLAGEDRGPGRLLPDLGAGHRLRHHLLLGGPDADVRLPLPAAHPLRGGGHPRDGPRRPGQEDVQVVRERHRPDRADGPLRHRRPPLRPDPRGQPGHRRAPGRGVGRGRPQLRQQALEPGAVRDGSIEGATSAPPNPPQPSPSLALADRWLLSRLERTRAAVTAAYDGFDPAEAARLLHGFAWSELADWAVELAKPRLAAGGEDAERAGATLAYALEVTLALLHPVMPFVTEELSRALTGVETLTRGPWPAERPGDLDPEAEAGMADLQEAIVALRRFRAEHRVPTTSRPRLLVVPADEAQATLFRAEADSVRRLVRLEAVEVGSPPQGTPAAKLLAGRAELYLPLEGLLDLEEERARLDRELATLGAERARAEAKLANPAFLEKAPAPVVAKARERLAEVDEALAKVRAQQTELAGAR